MSFRSAAPLLPLILLASCVASEPLSLPEAPAASILLALEDPEGETRVLALAPDQPAPPFTVGSTALFALIYETLTLESMGVTPGLQPIPTGPTRPFPAGYRSFEASADRDAWSEMMEGALTMRIGDDHLAAPEDCESAGGCYVIEGEAEFCQLPCVEPDRPTAPDPPGAPELPDFSSCPNGWRLAPAPSGRLDICTPPRAETCPAGWTHFLTEPGCTPVTTVCPTVDDFADAAPVDGIFVRPGATAGDGTRAAPYGSIAEALPTAITGDTLVLAIGTHSAPPTVDRTLTFLGACETTRLEGGGPTFVVPSNPEVTLANLTFAGAGGTALRTEGTAIFDGVIVEDAPVQVAGSGELRATRSAFQNHAGRAIDVLPNARATLTDVTFEAITLNSIRATGGTLEGTDLSFANLPSENGVDFFAIFLDAGATGTLTRLRYDDVRANNVALWNGSSATVTDHAAWEIGEYAIDANADASVTVERLVVDGADFGGIWINLGSSAVASDVYVRGARVRGIQANPGCELDLDHALVETSTGYALSSIGARTTVRHLQVFDTEADPGDGNSGVGIRVFRGTFDAALVKVDGARRYGILVPLSVGSTDPGSDSTALILDDVEITNVEPGEIASSRVPDCVRSPAGIAFSGAGVMTANRLALTNTGRGLGFQEALEVHTLNDIRIDQAERLAFCAFDGGFEVERLEITDTTGIGMEIFGSKFSNARHVGIHGTQTLDETYPGAAMRLGGMQTVVAVRISEVPLDTFYLSDNRLGARINNNTCPVFRNGEFADSEIAIEVDQVGFELDATDVIYRNNETRVNVLR